MDTLFGRYRLLERLGQGGMAEVFKAKSYGVEGFEKILVIKRILSELARSPDFVEMFIHEAKLAVRLSHPNIVQVFDLGKASDPVADGDEPRDVYYIAMEHVHGLDLARVLGNSRRQAIPMPIPMGVYVAAEVAKGLDHAHRRRDDQMRPLGIVHRDVSPQNVLVSFEGEVKVTDFGIAKARGALAPSAGSGATEAPAELKGKFSYMSPEQARAENVDARSDLFSLGTVLFECIAGVNPFSAPTANETIRRVQECEHPPLELLRPDAPVALIAIAKTAMAKAPGDRYPDAGRMYEALLALLYEQGNRYGARDLAEFVSRFRASQEPPADAPVLEREPEKPPSVPPPAGGTALESVRTPPQALARFVGRKNELRRIGEVLALATRRSARVLTIRGDRCVGKTRLIGEVGRRLRKGGHNVGFYAATCPEGGDALRLSGIVSMLQRLCGTRDAEPDDRVLAVKPRLRALGLQEDETGAVLSVLGAGDAAASTDALLQQAFTRMVQSLCEDRIHAFAWDDAHRMDRDSFAMLGEIVQSLRSSRLVFVFAGQPALVHPLESAEGHFTIDLKKRDSADVEPAG